MDCAKAWEMFEESKRKAGKSKDTIGNYGDAKNLLFEAYPEKKQIEDFTGEDLEKFILGLKSRKSTMLTRKKQLNVFFAWLVKREIIKKNPVTFVETIAAEATRRESYTPQELEKIMKSARQLNHALWLNIGYCLKLTTRPPTDFTNIDPKGVNTKDKIARIFHGKINRWVNIEIVEYGLDWIDDVAKEVYPTAYYKRPKALANDFKELCLRIGIPKSKAFIYTIRHTYCTMLAVLWGDPMKFMAQVGWTNVNQARTYVHEAQRTEWAKVLKKPDPLKEINEKLDKLMEILEGMKLLIERNEEMRGQK